VPSSPPSSPLATDRLSADARREALLDVARQLVESTGPSAITMGVVAERAQVTRALVYKHFANKHELLDALYQREALALDRRIRAAVEAAADGFEPKLRAFIGASLDAVEEHGPFFTPLRAAGADASTRQDQPRRDRATVGYFADLAARDFGIDHRTARSVIAVLFSGIRSLLAQMRSRPGAAQRRFLLDTYVELAIGGLTRLAAGAAGAERRPGTG
jgi:AcrR family transcriptional regulator